MLSADDVYVDNFEKLSVDYSFERCSDGRESMMAMVIR